MSATHKQTPTLTSPTEVVLALTPPFTLVFLGRSFASTYLEIFATPRTDARD